MTHSNNRYNIIRRRKLFEKLQNLRALAPADDDGESNGGSASQASLFSPDGLTPPTSARSSPIAGSAAAATATTAAPAAAATPVKIMSRKWSHGRKEKAAGEHFTVRASVPSVYATAVQGAPGPFVPSPEWLESWRPHLPLQTTGILINTLVPEVHKMCSASATTVDEEAVLEFLKKGTLVGLLPAPAAIRTRRTLPVPPNSPWFAAYFWMLAMSKQSEPPIWHGTVVRLFNAHTLMEFMREAADRDWYS